MTRAAIRLQAYLAECLERAKRGGRHWLRLPLAAFMRATGYAERTARGAWAQVRDHFESRLIRIGRSDVSMVALPGTLSPCTRTEGQGKPSVLGNQNITEHAPQTARTTEKFPESIPTAGKANRDPLRRLAALIAWHLRGCHWDCCRVLFNPGFAFAYAAKALALGYDRATVERAYETALREEHAVASDVGAASWRPFRVMSIALRKLAGLAPDWNRESYVKPVAPARKKPAEGFDFANALAALCNSVAPDPHEQEDYTHDALAA